jgi:environmental stress-induced protein Ves
VSRHLTLADYLNMPWANGRGTTVEILRHDADGRMMWRLSMATVSENGLFSRFPDIERNLTVVSGPGFDLVGGGARLHARPLHPVTFAGDTEIRAENVTATSVDFNVMTHQSLPLPHVEIVENAPVLARPGATLCLFALGPLQFGNIKMAKHDLLWAASDADLTGVPALAIHLFPHPG